jgi:hypothetical protein
MQENHMCRYPRHDLKIYSCGEDERDRAIAAEIQKCARKLKGLVNVQADIVLTDPWRRLLQRTGRTPDEFLETRLALARGGALHQVLSALRSSGAALYEHLHGTNAAALHFELGQVKKDPTGDVIGKLHARRSGVPPRVLFEAQLPEWLKSRDLYRRACDEEIAVYEEIDRHLAGLSAGRERAKAQVLAGLLRNHRIVLAFDSHLIALADLHNRLALDAGTGGYEVAIAKGEDRIGRERVQDWARLGSDERGKIALCSDVMSEGFNLQGASAVVHLDMPTVVRQAEQSVGRVDRLDSPFPSIDAWWPDDAPEFALTTDQKFFARHRFVTDLLGSNIQVPRAGRITTRDLIEEFEREAAAPRAWDHLSDAFEPVRGLIGGEDPLIGQHVYAQMRSSTARHHASQRRACQPTLGVLRGQRNPVGRTSLGLLRCAIRSPDRRPGTHRGTPTSTTVRP